MGLLADERREFGTHDTHITVRESATGYQAVVLLIPKEPPRGTPAVQVAVQYRGAAHADSPRTKVAAPSPAAKPTIWEVEQDAPRDVVALHVGWTWTRARDGKDIMHQDRVSLVHQAAYNADAPPEKPLAEPAPPRLIMALNAASPAAVDPGTETDELALILRTICARLDEGLDGLWSSVDQRFPDLARLEREAKDHPERDTLTRVRLDELWARRLSELLLLTLYGRPGPIYRPDGFTADWERELALLIQRDADPVTALSAACQHLTTAAWATRGFGWKEKVAALTAGAKSRDIANALGGSWYLSPGKKHDGSLDAEATGFSAARSSLAMPEFGPGAVFAYAKVDNNGGAHIAFVLRASRARNEVQFFDTGAMDITGEYAIVGALAGGNRDEPSSATFRGPSTGPKDAKTPETPRGLGLPPPTNDAELRKAVARLARTRPLGIARLVLTDRKLKTTLYVSPWLRMWRHVRPDLNYSLARYAWSLRDLPGHERIEARWLIDAPRGPKVMEAFLATDEARSTTLPALVKAATGVDSGGTLFTFRLVELSNLETSGQVKLAYRYGATVVGTAHHALSTLPASAPAGLAQPPYLRQEQGEIRTGPWPVEKK